MSLNYVTLTLDVYDGQGNPMTKGTATFTPSAQLTDTSDHQLITQLPLVASFHVSGALPTVKLLATDNGAPLPAGWGWSVTFAGMTNPPAAFSFFLPFTAGSSQFLSAQVSVSPGGGLGGPLVISAVPAPVAATSLPVGYGDSEGVTGLQVVSSYPSDDITNGTDGTGRISLYSYQRANVYSFGETIRNFLMRWDAKANLAWYGPVDLYDGSGNAIGTGGWKPWAWTGAHYESNSDSGIHGHWEVEVPDSTGALQGRLTILFANQTTGVVGLDKSTIATNLADFHVFCHGLDHTGAYQEQMLRLTGSAGFEKALEWNDDNAGTQAFARWRMAATADAESGSNAGTNWALYRYSDGGTQLGTPITIARATGIVLMTDGGAQASFLGVGTAPSGSVPLLVTGGSASVTAARFLTAASGSGGNTQPIVQSEGQDVLNRAYAAALASDTSMRWAVYTDGTTQWGTGAANRDVQLQRTAAGQLTLTDLASAGNAYLLLGGSLLVGATSVLGDGGAGVLALANAGTAPGSNPSGGVVLYSASGVLKLLGTAGAAATVLTTSSVVSGQYLATPSQYTPASQVILTISSTTMAAFAPAATTVAAGSNGGEISAIGSWSSPSAGVLDVATTTGMPPSGTATVATSTTPATITYTGIAAGQLTGCAYVSGSATGTVSTGGAVTLAAPVLTTGAFTAPPSGAVVVTAAFAADPNTGSAPAAVGLAAHGTVTPVIGYSPVTMDSTSGTGRPYLLQFYVTSLTPGNSYQLDLVGAVKSGDTFSILAFAQSTTTPLVSGSSGLGAPVLMTVQAV